MTIKELISIFDSLDLKQIPDVADNEEYIFEFDSVEELTDEKPVESPSPDKKYIIENGKMRMAENKDILNGAYCQFLIFPFPDGESLATIYYKM